MQRPIADPAEMPRVAQRDDRTPCRALVDAELHRLFADGLAETELTVDDRDGVVLEDDSGSSVGEHLAGFEPLHIGEHANDAVRIVADQIRLDECAAMRSTSVSWQPALLKMAVTSVRSWSWWRLTLEPWNF